MNQPIDLLPFCSKDEIRPALLAPFNADGYTYATDGAILVRVEARPEYQLTENHPKPPNCARVFEGFPGRADARFVPLTGIGEHPETVVCPECGGSGAVLYISPGGLKSGGVCPDCDGEKTTLNRNGVSMGHRRFAAGYLAKIMRLPGLLAGTAIDGQFHPLPFIFDGGEGLLMPMRKEGK